VTLAGEPPGRLELDGDLQLIERALTNLIDNAMRHAPGAAPVRVSLSQRGRTGARSPSRTPVGGLPEEVWLRLEHGQSLRDPPLRRSSGGIGGLGLAIAQRVAALHGGSLRGAARPAKRRCAAFQSGPVQTAELTEIRDPVVSASGWGRHTPTANPEIEPCSAVARAIDVTAEGAARDVAEVAQEPPRTTRRASACRDLRALGIGRVRDTE
jgi:signal transduction histidine kinase